MSENNSPSVRYMDFVGRRRASSTDPLVGRPKVMTPAKKPTASTPAVKPATRTPMAPSRTSAPAVKPIAKTPVKPVASARAVPVTKSNERELVARKPSTEAKELYPTRIEKTEKPVVRSGTGTRTVTAGASSGVKTVGTNSGTDAAAKSPFLKDYSIDKRPLSNSVPEKKREGEFEKLSYLGVSEGKKANAKKTGARSDDAEEELTSESLRRGRKNVYAKKNEKKSEKKRAGEKSPVKIIDDTEEKGGIPLFVIILITILLGAAVGAGLYFLLPK